MVCIAPILIFLFFIVSGILGAIGTKAVGTNVGNSTVSNPIAKPSNDYSTLIRNSQDSLPHSPFQYINKDMTETIQRVDYNDPRNITDELGLSWQQTKKELGLDWETTKKELGLDRETLKKELGFDKETLKKELGFDKSLKDLLFGSPEDDSDKSEGSKK
jgi:hypothetical protein